MAVFIATRTPSELLVAFPNCAGVGELDVGVAGAGPGVGVGAVTIGASGSSFLQEVKVISNANIANDKILKYFLLMTNRFRIYWSKILRV